MKRPLQINPETVNALLPAIPPEFEDQMRGLIEGLAYQRKEQPMKKKLSFGLALALVLTLLAVSALAAALLGGKDFVDQIMAPKALENSEEKYTPQEIAEIFQRAEENGIALPEDLKTRILNAEDGYYKEELMRVFVKTEYGFYPSAWPLPVQAWYEEMVEACGQGDGQINNILPGEGEITEEEALKIAADYIRKNGEADADVENKALYLRHMTYTQVKVNPTLWEKSWWFGYEAQDLYHSDFYLSMSPQGEVTDFRMKAGIEGSPDSRSGQFISGRFARLYGDRYGFVAWDNTLILEYRQALLRQAETYGADSLKTRQEKAVAAQTYVTPDETMLSRDQAIAIAREALAAIDGKANPATTLDVEEVMALCLMDGDKPVWKVQKSVNTAGWGYVQLDAITGEVTLCEIGMGGWRALVSESYYQQNKPAPIATALPGPTLRPDGKPWIWYSPIAPDWFWARMDEIGYDTATLINGWYADYGWDTTYWPLEGQVIYFIRFDLPSDPDSVRSMPGLPAENEVQQEEAIALARDYFRKENAERLPGLDVNALSAGCSFWFNMPWEGRNQWVISLSDAEGGMAGQVWLDAATGALASLETVGFEEDTVYVSLPTPTPQPDGSPWMWNSAIAPAEHWEALDAAMQKYGITDASIDALTQDWNREYGDSLFWPLEYKAAFFMLRGYTPGDTAYAALPGARDIAQSKAEQIAWDALRKACVGGDVTEEWINSLKISVSLQADSGEAGAKIWLIQFCEPGTANIKGYVELDSETGNVRLAELTLNSNG